MTAATGFEYTLTGTVDSTTSPYPTLVVGVTPTAPIVDRFCWYNRSRSPIDTPANDLGVNPYAHTIHCLVEVERCRNSGYAYVQQPFGTGDYEILYLLDAVGNNLAEQEM